MKSIEWRKKRVNKIIRGLKRLFPKAKISLNYSNHWELLIAVILSAQCTDKMVNKVTEKLFRKYKTLDDYLKVSQEGFEKDIRSTGFYKNKAKNILATARIIRERFHGKIPNTMKDLLTLRGVARKTANVILGNAYGIFEGIAVDTHVRRLSKLYGFTENTDPDKIERDLMEIIPKKEWFDFTYRMIAYGRTYCFARRHDHDKCPLTKILISG